MAHCCRLHDPLYLGKLACPWNGQFPSEPFCSVDGAVLAIWNGIAFSLAHQSLGEKMAHFSEYALLSILVHNAFSTDRKLSIHRFAMVCVAPVMVACVDETIQRFVPGRCGTPVDVLIDCCGAAFGILVCHVMGRVLRRRKIEHE